MKLFTWLFWRVPPVFSVQLSWLDQHLGFGCWLTWEEFSGFHYRRGREYCLWSLFHPHLEQDRTLGNFQIIWPFNMTWQPQFLFFRLAVVIAIPNCLQSRKNYCLGMNYWFSGASLGTYIYLFHLSILSLYLYANNRWHMTSPKLSITWKLPSLNSLPLWSRKDASISALLSNFSRPKLMFGY